MKIYASKNYVDEKIGQISEEIAGDEPFKQYVTDAEGKAGWEDRLAYKTFAEILPKTNASANESIDGGLYETVFNEPIVFEDGKTYKVIYNGTAYKSVAEASVPEYPYAPLILLGNKSLFGRGAGVDLPDTGEPFVLAYAENAPNEYGFHVSSGIFVDEQIEISIEEASIHKIPREYLPKEQLLLGYFTGESEYNIMFLDSSKGATEDEIYAHVCDGGSAKIYIDWPNSIFGYVTDCGIYNDANGAKVVLFSGVVYDRKDDGSLIEEYPRMCTLCLGLNENGFLLLQGGYVSMEPDFNYFVRANNRWTPNGETHLGDTLFYKSSLRVQSSSEGSNKKFAITVDDNGTLTATEVTE